MDKLERHDPNCDCEWCWIGTTTGTSVQKRSVFANLRALIARARSSGKAGSDA